ncbi:large subunit of alpha-aminoadipate reductase [Agyrium rufum]|nr:large subunit of alpha-aminoadipate reductase [Agyrium rufum]
MTTNGTIDGDHAILPDPTADLHWSDFRGAIHDIFASNAAKHPDRPCVVETPSSSTPQRTFTYKQINEAANILSHYLVDHGVERGDVVMVYAYRGVDLVIAVMGVLRAGATFSVIDPAYPPDRQKIYLEVAQPRALINIAKATLEAGQLSQVVRTYINESLKLKTEVPALCIRDGGLLAGGAQGEGDIFDDFRSRAGEGPNILVGPDSNPTLSFTSGSEGRPKGVLGRHFSLTYYFPWMAQRFGLSENDKFTMLSGIAHDPIQRDIFTPLFLGAQLLVPSKDVIEHEKLAKWMQDYEPTVTHLTPAMGQILVGGASSQFPSLHHAFFVGDLLTKRDCILLQNLGQNVTIINMYGTTETQRSVSYYEIPNRTTNPSFLYSEKDIMPAGKGMMDVQLLVVAQGDRTRQCDVGEVGEIYVRAGGLAEKYLGDDSLNEKKFVRNWFVDFSWQERYQQERIDQEKPAWAGLYKGPRDRLYRTGDLGRYLPSGDVECTGRADDQVKIRGFRIELGDINSHLSRHPLVRDSITLVRRNANEEPTLVSYIVPEFKAWSKWLAEHGWDEIPADDSLKGLLRRFRPLQNEVRKHLKSKLPAYAVPTHFIPLTKLPLNPNGKVDKPALPFPDLADLTAARVDDDTLDWDSLSTTEQAVAQIWSELIPGCDAKSVAPKDSFFDIGGHSILAQQMLLKVRRQFSGSQPTMALLFRNSTLAGFSASIDASARVNGSNKELQPNGHLSDTEDYAGDARSLANAGLPKTFTPLTDFNPKDARGYTVFLTGATGYLGAFLIKDLLSRKSPEIEVIVHARAANPEAALERIQQTCVAYSIWNSDWKERITCVTGNLASPRLGLDENTWSLLSKSVKVIIHNGAQVHWVYPYAKLRETNVLSTLEAIKLCAAGKPKQLAFISSTSVLDNDHYVKVSDDSLKAGGKGVSDEDDLEGSSKGLTTGYGQTKWVSEYLVQEAKKRGLKAATIRPGPQISNTINMTCVDYVARVVVASALYPPEKGVVQITSHPRLTFDEYLSALNLFGYQVSESEYPAWRSLLEHYVEETGSSSDLEVGKKQTHALMPLYHFVTGDLPANTKAPELYDRNAAAVLAKDTGRDTNDGQGLGLEMVPGASIGVKEIGLFLRYLVDIGFLPMPRENKGKGMMQLPPSKIKAGQKEALEGLIGRGTLM